MPGIFTSNETHIVLECPKDAPFIPTKHRIRPVVISSVASEHADDDAFFICKPFCLFKHHLGLVVSERLEPVKFRSRDRIDIHDLLFPRVRCCLSPQSHIPLLHSSPESVTVTDPLLLWTI